MGESRTEWTILERARERLAVTDALDAPGTAVLLEGAGGIGKSTLARMCAGDPSFAIVGLPELSEVPLGTLAAVVPGLGAAPVEDRFALAVQALAEGAGDRLVVVDDAAHLDRLSAAAVYQAVAVAGGRAILTARDGQVLPASLERLRHEGRLTVIPVEPFGIDDVERLLHAAVGSPPDPGSLRELHAISAGNPMYLRALIAHARRGGHVRSGDAGATVELVGVPDELVGVVSVLLAELSSDSLALLRRVVYAEPVDVAILGAPDAVARLVDERLVRVDGGVARVAHPIIRQAVRARVLPSEHRALTLEAAELLRGEADDQARIRRTWLLIEAGEPPAAEELMAAAEWASAAQDYRLAARLGELASEHGEGMGRLVEAVALSALGDDEGAERAFDDACACATDPAATARVASRAAQHAALRRGDPARAIALIEAARRGLDGAEPAARLLDTELVKWRAMAGGMLEAPLPPEPGDDASAMLAALLMSAMVQTMGGRLAEARQTIETARPVADAAAQHEPFAGELLDLDEYLVRAFDGELASAERFVEERLDLGSPHTVGLWCFLLATHHQQLGRLGAARDCAERAVRSLRWFDFTGLVGPAEALHATVLARGGDTARAEAALEEMAASRFADIKVVLQAAEARSWLLFERGRRDEAARVVADAAALGAERGHLALAALTAFVAVLQGSAEPVCEVLDRIAEVTDAALVHAHARHARAAAASDAEALDEVAADYLAFGHPLGAASALSAAAQVWERRGRGEAARASRVRAAALGAIEGLPAGQDRSFTLTAREREVAFAAARRERSREIAARLGISVRTVEHQLGSAYRKLGVSSRDELREALVDSGTLADDAERSA